MTTTARPGREDYLHNFHQLCSKVLTLAEKERLGELLQQYQHDGDVSTFVRRTTFLWSSPSTLHLLPVIRKLVAARDRPQFDLLLDIHHGLVVDKVRTRPVEKSMSMSSSRSGTHSVRRRGGIHIIKIHTTDSPRLGFSIRGGDEFDLGIFVSHVDNPSPAEDAGLRPGDQILEANGVDLEKTSSQHAAELLSSAQTLTLVIRRTRKIPEWKVTKERILWYDAVTKQLVPTPASSGELTTVRRPGAELKEVAERKIVLHLLRETDFLGFNIRGGKEFGIGIYVSRVDKGGLAERAGIQVGDHLVSVNNKSLAKVSHAGAVQLLRSSRRLVLIVWAVGKFPAYKELLSEYVWSDTGDKQSDSFSRAADVQGDTPNRPKASQLTQRAKTQETQVDRSPRDSGIVIEGLYADIDLYDENEHLPVQKELFYPRDQDIIFRGDYSHNWKQLDRTYGEDFELKPSRTPSQRSVRAAAREDHRSVDPDSSDSEMDYMTFLRRKMKRDEMRSRMSTAGSQRNLSTLSYDRPVIKAISMDNIARTDVYEVYAQVHKPPRQSSRSSPGPVVVMSSPSLARQNHVYHHDVHSDSSRSSVELRDAAGSAVSRSSSRSQHRPQIYVNGRTEEEDVVINKGHGHMVTATLQPRPKAKPRHNYDVIDDDDYTVVTEVLKETTTSFSSTQPEKRSLHEASLPETTLAETKIIQSASDNEEPKEDYIVETEVLEEATTSFSSMQPQNQSSPDANDLQPRQTEPDKENSLRTASTNPTPALTTSISSSTLDSVAVPEASKPQTAIDLLTEEIKRLEARKSSLGSREISRLKEPKASQPESEQKPEAEKKGGTWSALRKKLTGSIRIKKTKKRETTSSPEPFVMGSLQKKVALEHNSKTPMMTSQLSVDKYNMVIVQERARLLLNGDESDAVLRHISSYHDNHDVERLVELLIAILDKPEKIQLLKDIRGVIYAHHVGLFDSLVARHESTTFERLSTKVHLPLNPVYRQDSSVKPRSKLITTVLDADGHFHIKTVEQHERNIRQQTDAVMRMRRDSQEHSLVEPKSASKISKSQVHSDATTLSNSVSSRLPAPPDWRDDIEVIIVEKEPPPQPPSPPKNVPVEEGITIYLSKQKKNLGLIVCGGVSDHRDPSIRIEMVMPWGAAADDDRVQPGMQILSADDQSLKGMTQSEAIAVLKSCFNDKRSVNMKVVLRKP